MTMALAGIPSSTNTTARFPVRTIDPHDAHSLIQGNASGEVDMPRISPGHLLASALEIDSGSAHREGQPHAITGGGGGGRRWCSKHGHISYLGTREFVIRKAVGRKQELHRMDFSNVYSICAIVPKPENALVSAPDTL